MGKYIKLPDRGYAVFIGDTHGDYEASRIIINNFAGKKDYFIVMLGDYVDRGKDSRKNLDFLLHVSEKNKNVILLAGNHEMDSVRKCSPSDFWDSISLEECDMYNVKLRALPLVAVGNGFLALHGALPDIEQVDDINMIEEGDENWTSIIWGDFKEKEGDKLGVFLGRPKFGKKYFEKVMEKLEMNVLVRGHDPRAPEKMFNNRCLTLFTAAAYMSERKGERKIAKCDLGKEIKSIDDMEIISLDKPEI
ncbi:MAG TPA: metallophosphoesterase family protein [bacterium]|nr:metallophosphoesterase family protein [bacterium]